MLSATISLAASDLTGSDGKEKSVQPDLSEIEQTLCDDFSSIKPHTDDTAKDGAGSIGAKATATGDKVAFKDKAPECKTAAHEAAHTVQQREKNPPSTEGDAAQP